jgi:hypothetical protein
MNKGRIPRSLADGATEIAVQLMDRKSEVYNPPKPKFEAFKTQGRSLNEETKKVEVKKKEISDISVDENKAFTTVQVALIDGSKKKVKINMDEKLNVLFQYLKELTGVESFELILGYPKKNLSDLDKTIEEYGLKNSAIIQKSK